MKMTITYLEQYRKLRQEAEDLQIRLDSIGDVKAIRPKLNPGPGEGMRGLDDDIIKREEIRRKWDVKMKHCNEILLAVETYLDTVEDAQIRSAIRLKYIDGMSWSDVGLILSVDRSYISKKVKDYVRFHS